MTSLNVSFTAGDNYYILEITHYQASTRSSYWYPGDPGEVEIGPVVVVELDSGFTDFITYETFLRDLAIDRVITLSDARQMVEDEAYEKVSAEKAEDALDAYESRYEERAGWYE